jgi:hypothetical protein
MLKGQIEVSMRGYSKPSILITPIIRYEKIVKKAVASTLQTAIFFSSLFY